LIRFRLFHLLGVLCGESFFSFDVIR
jgi:hypothetical protein